MSAAESDDLRECENCGRLNNTTVNGYICYKCRTPFEDHTDADTLRHLYWGRENSLAEVSEFFGEGVTREAIRYQMEKHGISRRELHQTTPLAERFWEKVDVGDEGECWEFEGTRDPAGYGNIHTPDGMGKAHRVSARLDGRDPGEKLVLHHCDNPACVNPSHLYLGDRSDNMQDAMERGQWEEPEARLGQDNHSSKLTESDVRDIKRRLLSGEGFQSIADDFDVSRQAIYLISEGKNWSHVELSDACGQPWGEQ